MSEHGLEEYRRKRDFNRTPEPSGEEAREENIFVIQKHAASHLHYDFRLRLHGALKSWAISKGPSLDPTQHRLASETEDHPLEYADFEGVIPAGNYGAGNVLIWDRGTWEPLEGGKRDYYRGYLHFILHGERLKGKWTLRREKEGSRSWFLTKEPDEYATQQDILAQETSVVTGRTLEQIATDRDRLWTSDKGEVPVQKPVLFGHRSGGSIPELILPQAGTLVDQVPPGEEWLHEIKYDGYRITCRIDTAKGGAHFYTRKGYDFTDRLPKLREAVARLPLTLAWLDGEIVVFSPQGRSDFHALQNAFKHGSDRNVVYLVFDLMNYQGYDLRSAPLSERLEGIVSKRGDAEYLSQRSRSWLKVKCNQRQEFVVGGTPSPARGGRAARFWPVTTTTAAPWSSSARSRAATASAPGRRCFGPCSVTSSRLHRS